MPAERRERIVDGALELIGEARAEAFLKWLTPKLLAEQAESSPSTVEREFDRPARDGTGSSGFDREALTVALVERALQRIGALVERSVGVYAEAAASLRSEADIALVVEAITADLDAYVPGIDAEDDVTGQERVFMLALATCDEHGAIARMLRDRLETNVDLLVPIYDAFLVRTGRRMAAGWTTAQLAHVIGMLLDGAALRRRYTPRFDDDLLAAAVVRIFWALSIAADGAEPDVVAELFAGLGEAVEPPA